MRKKSLVLMTVTMVFMFSGCFDAKNTVNKNQNVDTRNIVVSSGGYKLHNQAMLANGDIACFW